MDMNIDLRKTTEFVVIIDGQKSPIVDFRIVETDNEQRIELFCYNEKTSNLADKVEKECKVNGVDIYPILKRLQNIWNREEILSINISKDYVRVDSFSADSTNFVEIDSDLSGELN